MCVFDMLTYYIVYFMHPLLKYSTPSSPKVLWIEYMPGSEIICIENVIDYIFYISDVWPVSNCTDMKYGKIVWAWMSKNYVPFKFCGWKQQITSLKFSTWGILKCNTK